MESGERKAGDGITFLVSLGIASADEHHAHGSTLVELDGLLVEGAGSHALEEVYDVALQTQHHALRLGVAHATVVLDDIRVALTAVGLRCSLGHAVH